jgi:hypothetical protein
MNDGALSHQFQLERAKREIRECTDLDKLRLYCVNLLLQNEAQRKLFVQMAKL